MKRSFPILLIFFMIILGKNIIAQLSIDNVGVDYTIDFDNTVLGVNFDKLKMFLPPNSPPDTNELDAAAWQLTPNDSGFYQGPDDGGTSAGGWYSWLVNTNSRGIGAQPTGSFDNHSIKLKIVNNSVSIISELSISFKLYAGDDQGRNAVINYFGISGTDSSGSETTDNIINNGTSTIGSWKYITKTLTISSLNLYPGNSYYFTWQSDRGTGTGSSDEWGIDDIIVNASPSSASNTIVYFPTAGSTINEGDGVLPVHVSIINPDAANSTSVDLILISGDNTDIDGYSTQTVTFPSDSSSDQIVNINITDDNLIEGNDTLIFELQNVSGGNSAEIGTQNQFDLVIIDNDIPDIVINEILADPDGNNGDANGDSTISTHDDEFIEFINNESTSLDVSNWYIDISGTLRHTFPSGSIVPSGNSVVVFGGGNPTNIPGVVQTASTGGLQLNNTGETVNLFNDNNVLITNYTYGTEANDNQSIARNPDLTGDFVKHLSIASNPVYQSPGRRNADGTPLPVELSSFNAISLNNVVELKWETQTEINDYGFSIEKSDSKLNNTYNFHEIGFVNGNGNSNIIHDYKFIDSNIKAGKYFYRLKQIDNDGNFKYSKIITIDLSNHFSFNLSQNYPNPFNPTTNIKYQIAKPEKVILRIYDILGREVATLVNEKKQAGIYSVNFNSKNLSSGVYFYQLKAGDFNKVKKMLLLK